MWPPVKKIVDPKGFCRSWDGGRPHRVAPTGFHYTFAKQQFTVALPIG